MKSNENEMIYYSQEDLVIGVIQKVSRYEMNLSLFRYNLCLSTRGGWVLKKDQISVLLREPRPVNSITSKSD